MARRRRWTKELPQLTRQLIRETREEGQFHGSLKKRALAVIRQYWATNSCTQCDTDPTGSASHKIYALIERFGVILAAILVLGNYASARDTYGWRHGGI